MPAFPAGLFQQAHFFNSDTFVDSLSHIVNVSAATVAATIASISTPVCALVRAEASICNAPSSAHAIATST